MPLPWLTMLTYPMKYLCILRKYISRPLLLSQSGPCRHIGSEMYLQPSRPRMHANSASRENSRFLPQVLASFLTRSSDFFRFPQWRNFQILRIKSQRPKLKTIILWTGKKFLECYLQKEKKKMLLRKRVTLQVTKDIMYACMYVICTLFRKFKHLRSLKL